MREREEREGGERGVLVRVVLDWTGLFSPSLLGRDYCLIDKRWMPCRGGGRVSRDPLVPKRVGAIEGTRSTARELLLLLEHSDQVLDPGPDNVRCIHTGQDRTVLYIQ
jgi:hypothetical protein